MPLSCVPANTEKLDRVVVSDVIRLIAMLELEGKGTDITWNQVPTAIWTTVEPATAISTACLPHIKPVVKWVQQYYSVKTKSRSDLTTTHRRYCEAIDNGNDSFVANGDDSGDAREKAPSRCSINFTARTTSNVFRPRRRLNGA